MMTIEECSNEARKVKALEDIASALIQINGHLVDILNVMKV